jgi:signal transduction histidine kinase
MEPLLQSTSLVQRAYWLVRLRWLAIATLGIAAFVARSIFKVSLPARELNILVVVLVVYNFLLFDLLKYLTWGGKRPSHKTISRMITFQISADLFILTAILHYSGGIENPFFFYFVFHMVIASILLTPRQSYLQATLALFLFGMLIFLEYNGTIPHYKLAGFVSHELYGDRLFVFGTFFVFATTLYLVVYMTTSISALLRERQQDYERANQQLQQKDHLKNEYVLRLTHDIRGHLAAIESCLNIVNNLITGPLNEKQADMIERALRRTSKCMMFVNALLKLTRMKMGGALDFSFMPLKNIFFNTIAAVESKAEAKSIDLDYRIDGSIDEVYVEPVLIEEAITNMLLNAIKYTPEKGKVSLTAAEQGDSILIQISDTGIGIPPEEIGRLFEEFYRASNARKIERDGTGLGLSIVKQVVERHGGKVWAQNNPQGGSTFSFTLPKVSEKSGKSSAS